MKLHLKKGKKLDTILSKLMMVLVGNFIQRIFKLYCYDVEKVCSSACLDGF